MSSSIDNKVIFLEDTPFFDPPHQRPPVIPQLSIPFPFACPPLITYQSLPRPPLLEVAPIVETGIQSLTLLWNKLTCLLPFAKVTALPITHIPFIIFLSYHRLSLSDYAFASTISSVSIPKTIQKALSHPGWR